MKIIDYEKLDKDVLKKPIKGGLGSFGRCYYFNDDKVLKKFKDPINFIEANLKKMVGLQNDSYVFPEILIYKERELWGYIMERVRGMALLSNQNNLCFLALIESLDKLYCDTLEISKLGIVADDLAARNMTYDQDKKLRVYDTDFYQVKKRKSIKDVYASNLASLNQAILSYITDMNDAFGMPNVVYEMFSYVFNCRFDAIINTEYMKNMLKLIYNYVSEELMVDGLTVKQTSSFIRKRYEELR